MSSPNLARQLLALEDEIIAYQQNPYFEPNRLEKIETDLTGPLADAKFPNPFYDIFDEASELLRTGPYEGADPRIARFAYTRVLVGLGRLTLPLGSVRDHGCLQAELLHSRSLAWHNSRKKPSSDHLPAAVLFDTHGQPFAYQKSLGEPNTAISWRKTTFGTQAGAREVPANSLIRLVYDDSAEVKNEAGPAFAHRGLGLIAAQSKIGPLDVEFLRLANQRLPKTARKAAFDAALYEEPELADNRVAAEQLTGVKIKTIILALLKKGAVTTVA